MRHVFRKLAWPVGALAALVIAGMEPGRAEAGVITGIFYQYDDVDARNATVGGQTAAGAASQSSNKGETLSFNVSTLNYNVGANGNNTLGNFLGPDAPAGHRADSIQLGNGDSTSGPGNAGSYFLIQGSVFLTAGSHTFSITHDDGAQLTIAGQTFGTTTPTTKITETDTITTGTGNFDFSLGYGEVNGPPSILNFSIDGVTVTSTPEPSTMVGATTALICTAGLAWRRCRRAVAQPA